jgi:predicted PurR-regulated permease PerM
MKKKSKVENAIRRFWTTVFAIMALVMVVFGIAMLFVGEADFVALGIIAILVGLAIATAAWSING